MQDWKKQQVLREEQVTRLQTLVQVQEHRKEQRSSARCCPGSVPRTSSDHEERRVACEQSNVPLAQRCLQKTKSVDSDFQYQLGGEVQAIIPEFPSPEIAHETARNLLRMMQDRVSCCCSEQNAAIQ